MMSAGDGSANVPTDDHSGDPVRVPSVRRGHKQLAPITSGIAGKRVQRDSERSGTVGRNSEAQRTRRGKAAGVCPRPGLRFPARRNSLGFGLGASSCGIWTLATYRSILLNDKAGPVHRLDR